MRNLHLTEADVIACYISLLLADVIATCVCGRCYDHYNTEADVFACFIWCWLMLLPTYVVDVLSTYCNMRRYYLADVIAIYVCGRCYNHWGWCYCLLYFVLFYYWLMLLPICGRCYSHFWCNVVADVMATVGWVMVGGWYYYHQGDGVARDQWFILI